MNDLEQHIASKNLNEIDTMNQLQDAGIISDNCVSAGDVEAWDAIRAVKWLRVEDVLWL